MLNFILPYTKKYKWQAFLSPLMMLLEVIVDILSPILMANMVNIGIANSNSGYVIRLGLIMVALAFFAGLMGMLSSHFGATAGFGIANELRKDAYHKVQSFSFQTIDRLSVPSLITRLTTDAETIGMVAMMTLRLGIRAPFLFLFALIFAIRLDRELSFIFFIAIPLVIFILYFILNKAMPYFSSIRKKIDGINAVVKEQLEGIRVIKSFNRQDYAREHFREKNKDFRIVNIQALNIILILGPAMLAMIFACITAVLWFGGNRVYLGTMQAGNILAFLTYIGQIMVALALLSMYIINLSYGLASLKRIKELMESTSEIQEKEDPIQTWNDSSIAFEDVSFTYPGLKKNVLDHINLFVPSGMVLGIIGSTGSSKSTLVQMLPRHYDVDEGVLKIGGINIKDYDLHFLREQIAYVLQESILISGTIRSNLLWGKKDASDKEMIQALKDSLAWDFVKSYDDQLDHIVEQGGSNFSGGQKQRLSIARALIKRPKILILDDSSSALDTKTDARLRENIRNNYPDTTILFIAQRVESIKNCDKILVMENGRIVAFDSHDELMKTSPTYQAIVSSQERGNKNA